MGGNTSKDGTLEFEQMLKERRKDQDRRLNVVNPQKKYHNQMKEANDKTKLPLQLKEMLESVLLDRIKREELVTTISVISTLKHTEFEAVSTKPFILQSKHVFINYDKAKFQETQQEMKSAGWVLSKQLKKPYHPFWKLNKAFAEYVGNTMLTELTELNQSYPSKQAVISKLIQQWCHYLEMGCLAPYKRWLLNCVSENKFKKWFYNFILQEIWSINEGYLYSMMAMLINSIKPPLQMDIDAMEFYSSTLTPSFFLIDPKLQIEGHFCQAIYRIAEIENIYKPDKILSKFEQIQKSICIDIDEYHRVSEQGKFEEIDSDNILSISNYILCHIPNKIDDIHTHIQVLQVVYGDQVYYNMGVSSYMLSTVVAALEYLQGEEFKQAFKNKVRDLSSRTNISAPNMQSTVQSLTHRQQNMTQKQQSNNTTTVTNVEDGKKQKHNDFEIQAEKHVSSLVQK